MREALIVEDDPTERRGLCGLVAGEGYRVLPADSLASARRQLAHAVPDLALVDVTLPDGSGLELMEELASTSRPDIILVTGYATVDTAVQAIRAGARDFLTKPFDPAKLRAVIATPEQDAAPGGEARTTRRRLGQLIGASPAMQEVYRLIERVAPTDAAVLIQGESGTGKELVAQAIHALSERRAKPFVALNCGAVSPTLIESELFGHERGSFTGAIHQHQGHFERAYGGTLFLDEITEMPSALQTKLLRVLESRTFVRLGGERTIETNVRIIATTNRPIAEAIRSGQLREDLYYRLGVFPITVPPLRERTGDISLLAHTFLQRMNDAGKRPRRLTRDAIERLESRPWPGNVRELKNVVERAFILGADRIDASALTEPMAEASQRNDLHQPLTIGASLGDMERRLILTTLEHVAGDKRKAAEMLGVSLKTLYNRLHVYNYRLRSCRRA
jgi:two-component system response regulator AtoC